MCGDLFWLAEDVVGEKPLNVPSGDLVGALKRNVSFGGVAPVGVSGARSGGGAASFCRRGSALSCFCLSVIVVGGLCGGVS